jgi:hypothetical protein
MEEGITFYCLFHSFNQVITKSDVFTPFLYTYQYGIGVREYKLKIRINQKPLHYFI